MGDDPEEARLLVRAQSGDTAAFDSLITLHRERIYMHTFQIVRNEEDALDLTQETFIRAWKSLPRIRRNGDSFQAGCTGLPPMQLLIFAVAGECVLRRRSSRDR